jgi:ATP-binding cassette subfamily B protein
MHRKPTPLQLLLQYAKHYRGRVALLTMVYLITTTLLVIAPQMLSAFIDRVYSNAATTAVLLAIVFYLAVVLARIIMSSLLQIQLATVGQLITDEYRRDVMQHFLSLDSQHLSTWTSGEAITRLDEDVQGLFQYYYILFYKLTGSGLALIGILIALALKSGWLSVALLIVSVLTILGFKWIQERGIPKYVRRTTASAAFNGSMKELLDNATTLRALQAEKYATGTLKRTMTYRYFESLPANMMYANLWSAATVMQDVVVAAGLFFALLLWTKGTITIGTAYLIYTYSELVITPLQDFRNFMGKMQSAMAGIMRTQDLLATPVLEYSGSKELSDQPIAVTIENLSFAYAQGQEVLKDIDLALPAGGRVGIMGETGCGKSSLINLIAGLNPYEKGSIRFNGIELSEIKQDSLRQRVAFCTQRVQLIHGTLRDNIAFFDEKYTDQDLLQAIANLNLSDWFSKFPQGLNTPLEMGEGSLSSGEAQLITLIRFALREPRLVLLDEITSNLDAAVERHMTRAIEGLSQGRTVIAIAHNAKSLDWMDNIVTMQAGKLQPALKGVVV